MNDRTVALVGCVKEKRNRACAARDLYISNLFIKSRAYAQQQADEWFILSAKYGLVSPEETIEPYEQTLNTASAAEKRRWAQQVHDQMAQASLLRPGVSFLWLAGQNYKRHLAQLLAAYPQLDPLEGKRMGERLSWLKAHI